MIIYGFENERGLWEKLFKSTCVIYCMSNLLNPSESEFEFENNNHPGLWVSYVMCIYKFVELNF